MTEQLVDIYPASPSDRDNWILRRRPARESLDPLRPSGFFVEQERSAAGDIVATATILLTNRECPWRCVMCDLWRNTLTTRIPLGAVPAQIDFALAHLPPARQMKLYNSGSFFDPQAIPPEDYDAIAARLTGFDTVIVESHPSLIGANCLAFKQLLNGRLEVAMGLETAHPTVLEKLNKRMTLDSFERAAGYLHSHNIDLRAFILVQPPFMKAEAALYWAMRSLDFAFDCGASAATLIPTRANNGAMEVLAATGEFLAPRMDLVEAALIYGLSLRRGRVFADLWDISSQPSKCPVEQLARLQQMNLHQVVVSHESYDSGGTAS